MVTAIKMSRCPRWCARRRIGHVVGHAEHRSTGRRLWRDRGTGTVSIWLRRPRVDSAGTVLAVLTVRGDSFAEAEHRLRPWDWVVDVAARLVWRSPR